MLAPMAMGHGAWHTITAVLAGCDMTKLDNPGGVCGDGVSWLFFRAFPFISSRGDGCQKDNARPGGRITFLHNELGFFNPLGH